MNRFRLVTCALVLALSAGPGALALPKFEAPSVIGNDGCVIACPDFIAPLPAFRWSMQSQPIGSTARLRGPLSVAPRLPLDAAGDCEALLTICPEGCTASCRRSSVSSPPRREDQVTACNHRCPAEGPYQRIWLPGAGGEARQFPGPRRDTHCFPVPKGVLEKELSASSLRLPPSGMAGLPGFLAATPNKAPAAASFDAYQGEAPPIRDVPGRCATERRR